MVEAIQREARGLHPQALRRLQRAQGADATVPCAPIPPCDPRARGRVALLTSRRFRAAIQDGGALGVMSSYNDYDGVPVTGSPYFLTGRPANGDGGSRATRSVSDSKARGVHPHPSTMSRATYLDGRAPGPWSRGLNVRTEFTEPDIYINAVRELVRSGRLPHRDRRRSRARTCLRRQILARSLR